MHIPDGFLTTPVWAAFDAAAIPAVAYAARRARAEMENSQKRQIPLLGVMGAFVFAAQMIDFPLAAGTSGHLVGGALLAITLGPAAAISVMTAILILQALIFQDGGIVVLGANIFNMAIAGVLAGYLPYWLWGRGRTRGAAIFLGGMCSVAVSACLALGELRVSGVPIPPRLFWISLALFGLSALIEGAITLAAARAIARLNPVWIREAAPLRPRALAAFAACAAVVAIAGVSIASRAPDALQILLPRETAPLAGGPLLEGWPQRAAGAFFAMMLIYGACIAIGRRLARPRSA
jgi:cobalt/nickel transport system permease protein